MLLVALGLLLIFKGDAIFGGMAGQSKNVSYSRALDLIESGAVSDAAFKKDTLILETKKGDKYTANLDAAAPEERARLHVLLQKQKIGYKIDKPPATDMLWTVLISVVLPMAMLLFFWLFIIRGQGGGGSAINFGRSKAKRIEENSQKVTFDDVAGIDEAKTELGEVVDFLRDSKKYQKLGAKIPKGVLLLGPPGCGKTLLARAIAGEAKVPFFYISGSDFVEMFVGVGASRVRDLFNNAKENRPCLVFIDEIDAVGRHRGTGIGGGNDEREQTLNQLLIEMDGFETNSGVILVAATNRPDVLDPALLRPGRFDRQITVDLPDVKGREKILLVHAKNKPVDRDVDFKTLAARTAGFSGAELANLVNEAALLAARLNQKTVTSANFSEAIDKVLAGPERKSMTLNAEEKKMTAYHEAGHAIVIETLAAGDKVQKVSIMPRGRALGLTWHTPQEDRYTQTKTELLNRICGLLGGRVTEAVVYNEITTGAANDLERATGIVRTMICELGMSDNLGPIVFGKHSGNPFLGKDIYESRNYSESVAQAIDAEIKRVIDECYAKTESIINLRRDALDSLAALLEEKETIERDEFLAVCFPEKYKEETGREADAGPEGQESAPDMQTGGADAGEEQAEKPEAAPEVESAPEEPSAVPPAAQEDENDENQKREE